MVKKNANGQIEWILSFLNSDLKNFSHAERMKLLIEMAAAYDVPIHPQGFLASLELNWSSLLFNASLGELENIQLEFEKILSKLKKFSEQDLTDLKKRSTTESQPEKYFEFIHLAKASMKIELTLSIKPSKSPEFVSYNSENLESAVMNRNPDSFRGSQLDLRASSQNLTDLMTYFFFEALKGLPIDSINRCDECQEWFCRTSLRGKKFCSSRCASKKASKLKYSELKKIIIEQSADVSYSGWGQVKEKKGRKLGLPKTKYRKEG